MAFLPGDFQEKVNEYGWTREQKIAYLSADYLIFSLYILLVVLALHNMWVIVMKEKEYKNLPILMFYLYALIAIAIRPIYIVWKWTDNSTISNM